MPPMNEPTVANTDQQRDPLHAGVHDVNRDAGEDAVLETGDHSGEHHDDDNRPSVRQPPKYTDSAGELSDQS